MAHLCFHPNADLLLVEHIRKYTMGLPPQNPKGGLFQMEELL